MTAEPAARPDPPPREQQLAMYRRACEVLPGGTNSNFRAWGEDTVYIDRGKGGTIWDRDGNEYIDLRMGYGPVILGHGDDRVDDYVNERMRTGVSFSLTSEDEVRAMELVKELNPWIGKARMTVSGTEATMHAMRVARAYTGRDQDREVRGPVPRRPRLRADQRRCPTTWPTWATRTTPSGSPGAAASRPRSRRRSSRRATTTSSACARCSSARARRSPPIIVEPVLGNAQGIMPKPGFHQAMRALTEEFGILLIFDEVKTGFRFARGGAAEFFGITPDIATYAKAMGNGYPAAAFGGREEIMAVLPDKVSHGGTYAGNRVAAAAAVKTLEILRDTDALATIHATGETDPGRHPRGCSTRRASPTTSPATPRCSASCSPSTSRASTATGRTRTTSCTTRSPSACTPAARCRSRTAASPGSCARRTRRATRSTGSLSIFGDSLDAALEARAHGDARHATEARRRPVAARPTEPGRRGVRMTLDGNAVRSVDRAAALLLALGESHGEAGVTELARRLGLHKSTASRLLATLEKRGLVEQDDETGRYRLGLVVIRLAEKAERTLDLRAIAMPELDRLARATRETTGLGVADGDQFLTVAQADGPNLVAMGDWTGRGVPIHSVAAGKVLLASHARARDPPARAPRPRPLHGPDDHPAGAAPRGAGPGPPPRVRDGVRRVRRRAQRRRGARPRRPRPGHRRRGRLGPGLPDHAAAHAGARPAGPRVGRRRLRPARAARPRRLAVPLRGAGSAARARC